LTEKGHPLQHTVLRHCLRSAILFGLATAIHFVSSFAWAQAPTPSGAFATSGSDWEGYSEFIRLAQRELGSQRVKPTARLHYDQLEPEDALVIVRPQGTLDERSLSAFLADGGRVALLDDYGTGDSFLRRFNIFRKGAPANPERRLRDNADLAIAVPSGMHAAQEDGGLHPMVQKVEAVVTNHPIALRHPQLTPVLEIRDKDGSASDIAITGVIAKRGRLFALGDPSVFINLMLRYPGNRHLAQGLIGYLSERGDEQADHHGPDPVRGSGGRLWIVTNRFEEVGSYGREPSLLDQLSARLKELRASAEEIEKDGIPPGLAMALALLLSIWVISTMISRNLRGGELLLPSFARAPALAAQTGVGARASVLGAKNANPVLALMELDAALRETIGSRLNVNAAQPRTQLLSELITRGLSRKTAEDVCDLLLELRHHGESLSKRKRRTPTDQVLKGVHQRAMRLLNEIETAGRKS
jgi:hypothetical protein